MTRFSCCCDWGFDVLYPRPVCPRIDCLCAGAGMVEEYEFAVAGVTGGNCSSGDCSEVNKTWKMVHSPNDPDIPGSADQFCFWKSTETVAMSGCLTGNKYWELFVDAPPFTANYVLRFRTAGAVIAVYFAARNTVDCDSPVFTRSANLPGTCTGWPATLNFSSPCS